MNNSPSPLPNIYKNAHGTIPQDLLKRLEVLKKSKNQFNCLVYEMLFIRTLKPNLNVQQAILPIVTITDQSQYSQPLVRS